MSVSSRTAVSESQTQAQPSSKLALVDEINDLAAQVLWQQNSCVRCLKNPDDVDRKVLCRRLASAGHLQGKLVAKQSEALQILWAAEQGVPVAEVTTEDLFQLSTAISSLEAQLVAKQAEYIECLLEQQGGP